jgi:hypothetical protein
VNEACIFLRIRKGKVPIITLYVDTLIFVNDESKKLSSKNELMSTLEMKDTGKAQKVLRIRTKEEEGAMVLQQANYVNDLLNGFHTTNYNALAPRMSISQKLTKGVTAISTCRFRRNISHTIHSEA